MKIVRVGLDVPVFSLFDYRADDATPDDIGRLAVVPFGPRKVVGVVLEFADAATVPESQLKTVIAIRREVSSLSRTDLQLLRFAAEYYHHPLGAAAMSAFPAALRRTKFSVPRQPMRYALTPAGANMAPDALPARASAQRLLLASLKECGSLDAPAIRSLSPAAAAALKQFTARGWIAPCEASEAAAPSLPSVAPDLTEEQSAAAQAIVSGLGGFHPFVLRGITGSGKTEVYLQAVGAALREQRQALILVPEIALTPQLQATVSARFPDTLLVSLHSGLNETERCRHWLAAQRGRAGIVLGTRLAVFAPMPQLGIIVVDEEHDASFKQMDGLRYSARDLAVVRAHLQQVPVVLGSATPALETHHNAVNQRYRLLTLSRRINAPPPEIECVATRDVKLVDGLSLELLDAVDASLARGEQSLVFINRRGYAPVLMCRACDWMSGCPRCSSQLVLHLQDRRMHCHHCGHETGVPSACPKCGNPDLSPVGQGTQRIEAALAARFPRARLMRIDRDSTRRKLAWQNMREQIQAREVDILVGTQILAKGHDFPHLNLVGVINADSLLYSADFRAPERLFALLMQVAGRAGRGSERGRVLVQTEFPSHPVYAALKRQDYAAFADSLLAEREQAGFPPFVYQALLRAEAPNLDTALEDLRETVRIGHPLARDVTLYDPVPSAMVRLAGRERAQLLIQSPSRGGLQRFLAAWMPLLAARKLRRSRLALDVDPLEF